MRTGAENWDPSRRRSGCTGWPVAVMVTWGANMTRSPDVHLAVVDERQPEVDVHVVAEVEVAAVRDVQRRLPPDPLAHRAQQLAQQPLRSAVSRGRVG